MYGCKLLCAAPDHAASTYPDSYAGVIDVDLSSVVPDHHIPVDKVLCVCAGISASMSVCVFAHQTSPSVLNSVCVESYHTATLPLRSGMLNVVVPLPTQYVVPITANNAAYVVLDTAAPSRISQLVGATAVDQILISHVIH